MIHHTELLRTNSDGHRPFSAPVGNYLNEVDCGIAALPCLTRCLRLEKCAKFGVFVTVLSLVGFFHGAILNYFRSTSHIWSVHYNISQDTIDWLIYTNEAFVGLFALCVAYWGNRIHRASWMGGLTIFVAVACITLAVPEIYNPFSGNEIDSTITGLALAANEIGKQAGTYFSWAPYVIDIDSIFVSPVWIVLTILTFLMGVTIAMFPKTLPNVVMMKSVNSLLSLASGNNAFEEEAGVDDKFCEIKGQRTCQFYSEYFSIFLATTTIVLMMLAALLAIILLFLIGSLELYKSKNYSSTSDLDIDEIRRNRSETNNGSENIDSNIGSSEEDAQHELLRRNRQMSDGKLNLPRPKSKEDRINTYLSEGQLVPPLKPSFKRGGLSTSKNSTNSGLSTDSLKAIANGVGDDHDSDSFSDLPEADTQENLTMPRKTRRNVVETEF
ncbi:hypothetical protein NQ314_006374 [Rhamnusium bicolor]|uniref:Uncharacterized protein n=1 Tax=Rhamnusium bicolor TaxID=1586634 RepID=A0AAV8Z3M5_9CUCU|nr:hypothetical protein NQ314_006374 [Rhamnusium bicolor]